MASRKQLKITLHSDTLVALDNNRKEICASRSQIIEFLIRQWVKDKYYDYYNEKEDEYTIERDEWLEVPF